MVPIRTWSLRRKTEEERQRKEEERARREFIRQEYLRRKQLKLMEDMDTVIKPRPPTAKQKKPRPKSMHRDHMEPPKTPTQGPPGNSRVSGGLFRHRQPVAMATCLPRAPPDQSLPGSEREDSLGGSRGCRVHVCVPRVHVCLSHVHVCS